MRVREDVIKQSNIPVVVLSAGSSKPANNHLLLGRFVGFDADVGILHRLLHDRDGVGALCCRVDAHCGDGGGYLCKLSVQRGRAFLLGELELAFF